MGSVAGGGDRWGQTAVEVDRFSPWMGSVDDGGR